MYLKSLTISSPNKTIREINFHKGVNLIIDESIEQVTGNNVGKTTVLKLIDFCLGANQKSIYVDPENKKNEYREVKDFLIQNKIIIHLTLTSDLDDPNAQEIEIYRNFLLRKENIREINAKNYSENSFEEELLHLIFPTQKNKKPSFRQLISHNIRYSDSSISNTLKTLDPFAKDSDYEPLYLYLFGCEYNEGDKRQRILMQLQNEKNFKSRLEKDQTKNKYEILLSFIQDEIDKLDKQKAMLNINENFETELNHLNHIKYAINSVSSEIGTLSLRKNIIIEAQKEIEADHCSVDLSQLKVIYSQATTLVSGIQKTFEELVDYHNRMIVNKSHFLGQELPALTQKIDQLKHQLSSLREEELNLSNRLVLSEPFESMESIIRELNELYQKKGEYQNIIAQITDSEAIISDLNDQLAKIDAGLFSEDFEAVVKGQLEKFNKYFTTVSSYLYGERYAVTYDIVTNKNGQRIYKFNAFNLNLSSGKKQGEISCFDIAYTQFADAEKIPCLHFILNDKKELVHENQLLRIAEYVENKDIQFIASILQDKLPERLKDDSKIILRLSQQDKLFRIEANG